MAAVIRPRDERNPWTPVPGGGRLGTLATWTDEELADEASRGGVSARLALGERALGRLAGLGSASDVERELSGLPADVVRDIVLAVVDGGKNTDESYVAWCNGGVA